MICSWSLLYDELNGTLDEEYPIMTNDEEWVKANGGYEYTPLPDSEDPKNYPPDGDYIYESPDGGKTVTRRKAGTLDKEVIHGDFYTSSKVTEVSSDKDFNDFMSGKSTPKPEPNLKGPGHRKYQEDKGIRDLSDYVSSTYQGHYTNDGSDVQTLDLIHSVGDAESFCRSNAIKYLSRYDKKGQAKRDILKAMHYCLLLYYFSGNANDEITTRGYETF